jgi:hypothetical protein
MRGETAVGTFAQLLEAQPQPPGRKAARINYESILATNAGTFALYQK